MKTKFKSFLTEMIQPFMTDKDEIIKWLKTYLDDIDERYILVQDDGTVELDCSFVLQDTQVRRLPVRFGTVNGDFIVKNTNLETLEGFPEEVKGYLQITNSKVQSLEHGPSAVGSHYVCSSSRLKNLKGAPTTIHGNFTVDNNDLETLEGGPEHVKGVYKADNNHLTSLKGIAKIIDGSVQVSKNFITSLKDIQEHIHEMNGSFRCNSRMHPMQDSVLGLLQIKGLQSCSFHPDIASDIVDNFLGTDAVNDIFECQEKLIEAGFDKLAQL